LSSEEEIESTVKKNQEKIFGFIQNRVSTPEDAEDILQEVWFQLSRVINLHDIENVSAWLYKVARNKITDWYKKSKPVTVDNDLFDGEDGTMIKNILFSHSETPDDKMFKDLFWQELMNGLNELPSNQKEVFIQNELEGLKLREIAENSNEKLKTIISRKQYAVKHLRGKLRNLYDDILN
jgi:RNA polymerase sigma factor (sigma-70 family)